MALDRKQPVTIRRGVLGDLEAIAEAAARVAEELGHSRGAENIRAVIRSADEDAGHEQSDWDDYGVVNEWTGQIKGSAHRSVVHPG